MKSQLKKVQRSVRRSTKKSPQNTATSTKPKLTSRPRSSTKPKETSSSVLATAYTGSLEQRLSAIKRSYAKFVRAASKKLLLTHSRVTPPTGFGARRRTKGAALKPRSTSGRSLVIQN